MFPLPVRLHQTFLQGTASCAIAAAMLFTFVSAQPASAAGLLVSEGGFGGVLEIKQQDVRVTINNNLGHKKYT